MGRPGRDGSGRGGGQGRGGHEVDGRGPERPRDEVPTLVPEHLGESVDLEGGRSQIGGNREVPLGVVAEVRRGFLTGDGATGRGQRRTGRRHHDRSEHTGELVVRVQGHVEVVLAGDELVPIGEFVPQGHLGGIDGDRGTLRGSVTQRRAPRHCTGGRGELPADRQGERGVAQSNDEHHGRAEDERDAKYRREACPAPTHTSILPACEPDLSSPLPTGGQIVLDALVISSPRTTADPAGDSGHHPRPETPACPTERNHPWHCHWS